MDVVLRPLQGPWNAGWALNKHMLRSIYLGDDEYGHARFESVRTDVGEATYQLKYRQDWGQAQHLARALLDHVVPKFAEIGFIVPYASVHGTCPAACGGSCASLGRFVRHLGLSRPAAQGEQRQVPQGSADERRENRSNRRQFHCSRHHPGDRPLECACCR